MIWLILAMALGIPTAYAYENNIYTVQPGDTLIAIALRHNVRVSQLAEANGLRWNSWVYVGQRLTIPGTASTVTYPANRSTYVVKPGDTLFGISRYYGISVSQLASANGLRWNSWVYVGQRLTIPGNSVTPAQPIEPLVITNERWIDVNLTTQTLTAYEGNTPLRTVTVSTGRAVTPTPVGEFRIWVKLIADDMAGPGYFLPQVPYTMYFYQGYAVHGTYWHNNFGTPMSHGCVNLPTPQAEWLFNWASVGTRVVTHY
jgi:lipoprotein-anchoring transpeptidase ErfK/SrfK